MVRRSADDEGGSTSVEDESKTGAKRRRTVRKGTHSCWACKRRKEKCSPDPDGGDTCHGCTRRGTKCISQEFVEDEPAAAVRQIRPPSSLETRIGRIESLVEQMLSKIQPQTVATTENGSIDNVSNRGVGIRSDSDTSTIATNIQSISILTPSSIDRSPQQRPSPIPQPRVSVEMGSFDELSLFLHRSLPCRQDLQILQQASSINPTLSNAHLTRSFTTLQCRPLKAADGVLAEPPSPTAHPVLIARYMLQIAIFLQECPQNKSGKLRNLSEPPAEIMQRCANTAMASVTNRDELHGSVESLECVMLESFFRCNGGYLRLSWMAARRAILLAQVMGLHLHHEQDRGHEPKFLDPASTYIEPRLVWFRIASYDLLLCRMLGLPPAVMEPCPPPFGACPDTPLGHLEYKQYVVMTDIQKRRHLGQTDFKTTLDLDQELQKVAKTVSNDWWLPPNLAQSAEDPAALFWKIRRLHVQVTHYDLINQLYVPHMFGNGQSVIDKQRSNLSRNVCVSSSREILSRYILFREFTQIPSSCRVIDFIGLMSAITLVLAHLAGSQTQSDSIVGQENGMLLHSAPSDRAMMEHALKNMHEVNRCTGDATSARSVSVLSKLLDIEARRGHIATEEHVSVYERLSAQASRLNETNDEAERIDIPYFGFIKIARKGIDSALHAIDHNDSNVPLSQPNTDPLAPPEVSEEYWDFTNLHMGFLDGFLKTTLETDGVYDVQ